MPTLLVCEDLKMDATAIEVATAGIDADVHGSESSVDSTTGAETGLRPASGSVSPVTPAPAVMPVPATRKSVVLGAVWPVLEALGPIVQRRTRRRSRHSFASMSREDQDRIIASFARMVLARGVSEEAKLDELETERSRIERAHERLNAQQVGDFVLPAQLGESIRMSDEAAYTSNQFVIAAADHLKAGLAAKEREFSVYRSQTAIYQTCLAVYSETAAMAQESKSDLARAFYAWHMAISTELARMIDNGAERKPYWERYEYLSRTLYYAYDSLMRLSF